MSNSNLPERLRALPGLTPPPGGWADLNRRLHARRRNIAMAGGGFALAASVLVAVGLVGVRPDAMAPPSASPGGTTVVIAPQASPAVEQLVARSQALERRLSAARSQVAVWNTGRDTRAALIQQELRRVDARINFADPQDAELLWRRRVQLMNALVDLHETEAPALQYASYQY